MLHDCGWLLVFSLVELRPLFLRPSSTSYVSLKYLKFGCVNNSKFTAISNMIRFALKKQNFFLVRSLFLLLCIAAEKDECSKSWTKMSVSCSKWPCPLLPFISSHNDPIHFFISFLTFFSLDKPHLLAFSSPLMLQPIEFWQLNNYPSKGAIAIRVFSSGFSSALSVTSLASSNAELYLAQVFSTLPVDKKLSWTDVAQWHHWTFLKRLS